MDLRKNSTKNNKEKLCIWDQESACEICELKDKLHCQTQKKYSLYFAVSFFSGILPALLGIIFSNMNTILKILILSGWVGYSIFFFLIWESKILCSHCPFYADEDQKTLHCYANMGIIKTAKYCPEPMDTSEKIQFIIAVSILIIFAYPFLLLSNQIIFFILSVIGMVVWILILQTQICVRCINFSCPLNRVPKEYIDKFLERNPAIKQVWESKDN
jgi:hypothetical protein